MYYGSCRIIKYYIEHLQKKKLMEWLSNRRNKNRDGYEEYR